MDGTADREPDTNEPRLRRDPRLHAVLLLATVSTLSVAVVSPVLPTMADALGVSDARIGLVMTAITLPPMLLAPVVGVASDMLGRRRVALPALALFGSAGMAIGVVDDFGVVLGLRALQGLAMAGMAPVAVTLLGDLYRGTTATTAQGLRTSLAGLGLAGIPLVAGWLAGFGWQWAFALYATAFPVGLLLYRYVPETAGSASDGQPVPEALAGYARAVRAELADRRLRLLLAGGFVRFFSLFAFLTFVPLLAVRTLGATTFEAGVLVGLAGVRVFVSPTAGRWVGTLGRRGALLVSLVPILLAFALIPVSPNLPALGGLAVLFGIGDAILSPLVNDAVTASVRAENRNGVVSALRVLKEAGKTAAPVVLGLVLAAADLTALFAVAAAVVGGYLALVTVGYRGG